LLFARLNNQLHTNPDHWCAKTAVAMMKDNRRNRVRRGSESGQHSVTHFINESRFSQI
jgi:hypothetical protein